LLNHSGLAANDIVVPDGSIEANVFVGTNYVSLDSSSVIHLKKMSAHPFIKYTLNPVKIYELKINTGWLNAQDIFDSFPNGMFESLDGIKVAGKLNYGFNFYPPGVVFIAIALGIIALATVKYQAMDDSRMLAASLAHEMRTPLATLKIQAKILSDYLPELIAGYKIAQENALVVNHIDDDMLAHLSNSASILEKEAVNANHAIDMLMALTTADYLNEKDFKQFSMKECVELAVSRAPYKSSSKKTVYVDVKSDFIVLASKEFLIFVLINLINNSLDALKNSAVGSINITIISDENGNRVEFLDDGEGINSDILPHIFDRFFTTKDRGVNSGVGLAFCRNVMESFGGSIICESRQGEYTLFILSFKSSK